MKSDASPQFIAIGGKRAVVLEEAEYQRLASLADAWEPPMPALNARGNYPADAALAVQTARDLIRRRRRAGLTQVELARRAGIRPETLSRIEHAKHAPSAATVEKIDRALKRAEKDQ